MNYLLKGTLAVSLVLFTVFVSGCDSKPEALKEEVKSVQWWQKQDKSMRLKKIEECQKLAEEGYMWKEIPNCTEAATAQATTLSFEKVAPPNLSFE